MIYDVESLPPKPPMVFFFIQTLSPKKSKARSGKNTRLLTLECSPSRVVADGAGARRQMWRDAGKWLRAVAPPPSSQERQ